MTLEEQKWRLLVKILDSNKNLFDIFLNIGHICMGFEADNPEKLHKHTHLIRLSDIDLV